MVRQRIGAPALKRSGFKRPERPEKKAPVLTPATRRATYAAPGGPITPVPKGEPLRPGKRAPTASEKLWMDRITQLGCIACWLDGLGVRPGAVHHLLYGGRRLGHLHTICLCDPGHHQGGQQFGMVSRHPWKTQFEERYGTEEVLLDLTRRRVHETFVAPSTKRSPS